MKKLVCLTALVLAMSSTAWGICEVEVAITQMVPPEGPEPECTRDVAARVWITCPGQCTIVDSEKTVFGNTVYLDFYLQCTSPIGSSTVSQGQWILNDAPCGPNFYIVVARVWCSYTYWPYCIFSRPLLTGMGSTYFTVCCEECGCCPCCCP